MKELPHPFSVSDSGQNVYAGTEQAFINISLEYSQKTQKFTNEELSETKDVVCIWWTNGKECHSLLFEA